MEVCNMGISTTEIFTGSVNPRNLNSEQLAAEQLNNKVNYLTKTGQTAKLQGIVNDLASHGIVSSLDINSPQSYIQSAYDLSQLNTMTSDAMAREQMAFQEKANAKAMEFSASEAQKVRDWEELLSNTAHQREVKDLIAAGLNPILSANQGASTPAAANANGVTSAGAKGSVDTSVVGALTQAYVQARQLEMQEKNIVLQSELQDKSIQAQLAMNLLSNETNRYMADKGAYANMSSAAYMASANRYSAEMSKMAQMYQTDMMENMYREGYLGNLYQKTITDVLGDSVDNLMNSAKTMSLFNDPIGSSGAEKYDNPNYESLSTRLGNFIKGLFNYDPKSKRELQ